MSKDSFWLKHDYNSRNDEKVLELRSVFGAEGYGIFWMLVETMAENNNGGVKACLMGGLSHGYGIAKDKLCEIIKYSLSIDLMYEKDGFYYSKRLDKHKEERRQFSQNGSIGASKRWATYSLPIDGGMQRREEERRGKKKYIPPETGLNVPFEVFWDLYDKKVGDKPKLEKKWKSLKDNERILAIKHIPNYKISQPDKQFRKNPATYLNNNSFNDEIIGELISNQYSSPPIHSVVRPDKEYWEIEYGHMAKTKEEFMQLVADGKIE